MRRAMLIASFFCYAAGLQGDDTSGLAFEVASIKPTKQDGGSSGIETKKGFIRARNVTLRRCIRGAYGIPDDQVLGGPKWMDENRYDIDARTPLPAGDHELNLMLQTLLADRFKLAVHRETKQVSGYVLVAAKAGPKMTPSAPETEGMTNSSRGLLEARASSIGNLALKLSLELHQPVADSTELKDTYNFKLQWTPDNVKGNALDAAAWPSLFTAIQEQLGLKLEPRKIPAEVLVIDHVEEPSAN